MEKEMMNPEWYQVAEVELVYKTKGKPSLRIYRPFHYDKKYLRKSNLAHKFASNYLRIMTPTRDIFQAIADPTRRQIIGMLARKSLNVNAIAKEFDITRQAVSLHVQFLHDCGLIIIKQQGRERYCEAKLEKLNEVTDWVNQYRKYWDNKLDSLESYLSKIQKKKK